MRLYFFTCGALHGYYDAFVSTGKHEKFQVPVPFFLIQHNGKNVLFDTGNHREDMAGHLMPELTAQFKPIFREDEWAPKAIEKVNLKPEDIDIIVMSHLHHDHAGAIADFPNATVIVQQSEYDYVRRPDKHTIFGYYNDEAVANNSYVGGESTTIGKQVDWFFLRGWQDNGFDLFRDGRIIIYFTPGHSIGHQSLLVNTDSDGSFLLTADACYLSENLEHELLPRTVENSTEYLQNLRFFRLLQKTGVQIVTGHDPSKWAGYKHAPLYYH